MEYNPEDNDGQKQEESELETKVGFARLTKEERVDMGRRGGKKAWEMVRAHKWTSEEASRARKKYLATRKGKS